MEQSIEKEEQPKEKHSHAEKPLEEQVIIKGGCPAIISEEQFERVQQKMKEQASGTALSKSRRHYMLGGMKLMQCAVCGRYMTGNVRKSHGKAYVTYRCPNHGKGGCPTKEMPAKNLEWFVSRAVANRLMAKENRPKLQAIPLNHMLLDEKKETQNKLFGIEKSLSNLVSYLEKNGSSETVDQRLKDLEQQKRSLLSRQIELEAKQQEIVANLLPKTKEERKETIVRLARFLRSDHPDARHFLKSVIRSIQVDNDTIAIDIAI